MDEDSKTTDRLCGCGRRYKHRNALWNHIRVNHNGLAPPGTIKLTKGRPATNPKNRRC